MGSDKGSASTFALVSGIGARLVLLMRCCFRRCLSFIDIKDAFLLVPQRERILVEKPSWWSDDGHSKYWSWNRCLPGQRNAAARFFDFLCDHLQEFDFENSPCCRSGVLWGIRGELMWLIEELRKRVTLQGGDVLPAPDHDEQEPIRFLKKRHSSPRRGLCPREKYAEELVKLHGLVNRKPKTTPDISGEVYDSKELDEEVQVQISNGYALVPEPSSGGFSTCCETPEPIHGQATGVS